MLAYIPIPLRVKNLLIVCLASLSITDVNHAANITTLSQDAINLWSPTFLASQKNSPQPDIIASETVSKKGAVSHILNSRMQVFLPRYSNHTAIIVMSGGGYQREELGKEGTPASKWLAKQGFTVFNLIYRLPNEGWRDKSVAFADAQRAVRLVRQYGQTYGYHQVGVLGFSAGGHLAGMTAVYPQKTNYAIQDDIDKISAKPDFAVLLYPIVSMMNENSHTRSEKTLLGKNPMLEQRQQLSLEQGVTSDTPPMFIAHAKDDPIANPADSILLDKKLQEMGVKHELQLYATGGHGWGLGKKGTDTEQWRAAFLQWVKSL